MVTVYTYTDEKMFTSEGGKSKHYDKMDSYELHEDVKALLDTRQWFNWMVNRGLLLCHVDRRIQITRQDESPKPGWDGGHDWRKVNWDDS